MKLQTAIDQVEDLLRRLQESETELAKQSQTLSVARARDIRL